MISHKPKNALMKDSVILQAEFRTKAKIEAKRRKARTGPVTVNNVIITFNGAFKDFDFGEFPPLVTEKTQKMLLGWIKLAKKEYNEAVLEYFSDILVDFVKYFNEIREKRASFNTLNGKPWRLSEYPDLKDLVICRDSIISAIAVEKKREEEKENEDEWEPKSIF